MVDISRFKKNTQTSKQKQNTRTNRYDITYLDIASLRTVCIGLESKTEGEHFISDSAESYVGHKGEEKKQPHFPNVQKSDDLIRDMGLTKSNIKTGGEEWLYIYSW